jgi:hypothetical protein
MSDETLKRQDRGGMSGLPQVWDEWNGGFGLVPCPDHPETAAVDCVVCEPIEDDQDSRCSYCGDTGWNWVNAVECTHCEAGAALAARSNAPMDGPLEATTPALEVGDD